MSTGVPAGAGTGRQRTVPATPALALGRFGRAWRVALVAGLLLAYVAGSLLGDDHWWPIGPWRMYSTSTAPTGAVTVPVLQVQRAGTSEWRDVGLNPASIGLSRAELEGRHQLVVDDPAVLATIAATHARLQPGDEPWTGVRLVRRSTVIEGRVPTGEVLERVVAEWTLATGGRAVVP